jgi:hypothetical protein
MPKPLKPAESYALRLAKPRALTDATINLLTGLTIDRISQLRREAKMPSVKGWNSRPAISELHAQIGLKLAYLSVLGDEHDPMAMATSLGWTYVKYHRVELGIYPLELLDIINLARVFNCTPADILNRTFGEPQNGC